MCTKWVQVDRCKPLLGTYVDIHLAVDVAENVNRDVLIAASETAFSRIQSVQDLMSFHDPESELSGINRDAFQHAVPISPSTHDVIKTALDISAASGGIYDISVAHALVQKGYLPRHAYAAGRSYVSADWTAIKLQARSIRFDANIMIDLGGIAKGYAVDAAFEGLLQMPIPFTQIIVNAGGDIRMLDWQDKDIVLRTPARWKRTRFVDYTMQNTALATSIPGHGSPSSRILDPISHTRAHTNRAHIKNWLGWHTQKSISIFADRCMIADALTKTMYLAPERTDLLERFNVCGAIVDINGRIEAI
ncbi:MAG: hypothetical protein COA69_07005 [Robiginitomaculum sp.]|nr:MAG: hypothetical protein COA69_07005 [Robiginitomaculum sp.]